jgi:predicted nucleic acid-binding protein
MIDFENSLNPYSDNRLEISMMLAIAGSWIGPDEKIRELGKQYERAGIKPRDALHLACAIHARSDIFITCDDRLAKRAKLMQLSTQIFNPVDFVYAMEVRQL